MKTLIRDDLPALGLARELSESITGHITLITPVSADRGYPEDGRHMRE
jgi:hypothetical protein